MFDNLSNKLQITLKKLKGHGKLSEQNIKEALREVRLALLEADVNFKVVKEFVDRVRERAIGQEVMKSLTPGQQLVKIVHEELTGLMGQDRARLASASTPPTVILLVGLQGSGKTTTAAKLANLLMKEGFKPLLVAADVYRPAAIKQLEVLGTQIHAPVYLNLEEKDPRVICKEALQKAKSQGLTHLLVDTAGRLHIDQALMEELKDLKKILAPSEILLVVDAMTGQDAVTVAERFNEDLAITGVILTKLDGDARGGAALSIKAVTQKPIKFIGTGEKLEGLEPFHPERMASRILGMGDVLSLIEKAEQSLDEEKARELEKKIKERSFTLEDFRDQLRQIRNMGPLDQLLEMIPGFSTLKASKNIQVDEKELVKIEAMINSMTPKERNNYKIINGSRRKRIALGSGTTVQDVNKLLKQFDQTRKMMTKLVDQEKKFGKIRFPF
ncbi:MAG TPA: signal recognition particle protein [Candidatus Limnocylindrales bacterium]|nr:signal recognition particle protein [Candidatus Limnocylindrales bacterium]